MKKKKGKAAAKSKKAAATKKVEDAPVALTEVPVVANGAFIVYRYKFQSLFGMQVLKSSALNTGFQFGYNAVKGTPLYVGPEMDFTLFSPGSLLSVLASAWYEVHFSGAPHLFLSLGAGVGPGYSQGLGFLPGTSLVTMLDIAVTRQIDDLVAIRAQFRPGVVDRYFSFAMNFDISFQFL